jgi:K+-transporting ATPase KdpF subunit
MRETEAMPGFFYAVFMRARAISVSIFYGRFTYISVRDAPSVLARADADRSGESGKRRAGGKKERQCSTRSWWCWGWARSPSSWVTSSSATNCEVAMLFDFVLGGIVALAVLAYLVVALTRPERF